MSGAARTAWLLALPWLAGCTLIADAGQCSHHSDCLSRGPAFANTLCSPEGACVKILSQDCSKVLGPNVSDDSVLIGHLTSMSGPNSSFGVASTTASALALSEIADFAKGIPAEGRRRPLSMVVCDDKLDPRRAARHLIDDLGVSLLIGPVFSTVAIDVANEVSVPRGALMLNPFSVSPLLTPLQRSGLLFRTATSNDREPEGMAAHLLQIEREVRGTLPMGEMTRVALMVRADLYGKGLADNIFPKLVINGASVLDGQNSKNVLRRDFPDPGADPSFKDEARFLQDIVAFQPHVMLVFGTAEMVARVEQLEGAWRHPAPYFIMSEGLRVSGLRTLAGGSSRGLSKRARVFAPSVNRSLYQAFANRWGAKNMGQAPPDVYGTTTTYDAVYLAAYSLASLRGQAPTGALLAAGLRRTVPMGMTPVIPAGTSKLTDGLDLLWQGKGIDYDGVSGPLNFDIARGLGEAPNDYDILCLQGRPTAEFVPVQLFRATSSDPGDVGAYAACP